MHVVAGAAAIDFGTEVWVGVGVVDRRAEALLLDRAGAGDFALMLGAASGCGEGQAGEEEASTGHVWFCAEGEKGGG